MNAFFPETPRHSESSANVINPRQRSLQPGDSTGQGGGCPDDFESCLDRREQPLKPVEREDKSRSSRESVRTDNGHEIHEDAKGLAGKEEVGKNDDHAGERDDPLLNWVMSELLAAGGDEVALDKALSAKISDVGVQWVKPAVQEGKDAEGKAGSPVPVIAVKSVIQPGENGPEVQAPKIASSLFAHVQSRESVIPARPVASIAGKMTEAVSLPVPTSAPIPGLSGDAVETLLSGIGKKGELTGMPRTATAPPAVLGGASASVEGVPVTEASLASGKGMVETSEKLVLEAKMISPDGNGGKAGVSPGPAQKSVPETQSAPGRIPVLLSKNGKSSLLAEPKVASARVGEEASPAFVNKEGAFAKSTPSVSGPMVPSGEKPDGAVSAMPRLKEVAIVEKAPLTVNPSKEDSGLPLPKSPKVAGNVVEKEMPTLISGDESPRQKKQEPVEAPKSRQNAALPQPDKPESREVLKGLAESNKPVPEATPKPQKSSSALVRGESQAPESKAVVSSSSTSREVPRQQVNGEKVAPHRTLAEQLAHEEKIARSHPVSLSDRLGLKEGGGENKNFYHAKQEWVNDELMRRGTEFAKSEGRMLKEMEKTLTPGGDVLLRQETGSPARDVFSTSSTRGEQSSQEGGGDRHGRDGQRDAQRDRGGQGQERGTENVSASARESQAPRVVKMVQQLSSSGQLPSQILDSLLRFRELGKDRLKIALQLDDGSELEMGFQMKSGRLLTEFRSDSRRSLEHLRQCWAEVENQAREKGLQLSRPTFVLISGNEFQPNSFA